MKCITPLTIRNKENKSLPVECGKCPECIKKRTSQWSFRLRTEGDASSSSHFITLTYNSENVKLTPKGFMTLYPEDVTLWLKRLRKISESKIKYYYVGEYGGKTERPHYHMVIFNAKPEDIERTWTHGAVHYGTVTGASIGYTLKYMIKDGKIPKHKNDDRLKEFSRMSKGLGLSYLTAETMYWHTDKRVLLERLHCTIDGKKIPIPRYYKERIYDKLHKYIIQQEAIKLERENLEKREKDIDLHRTIEAHKALFDKMYQSKYKNKHI